MAFSHASRFVPFLFALTPVAPTIGVYGSTR
jgi:hypothetical protein